MTKRALVLANGNIPQSQILMNRMEELELNSVIAADGGYRHARTLGVQIDIVIGDLDSFDPSQTVQEKRVETIEYDSIKDETDLELALLYAVDQDFDEVIVLGALNGRIDMVVGNIFLLADVRFSDTRIELWHTDQTAWVARPPNAHIHGAPGDTVSLIPLKGDVHGVSTANLVYSLRDGTLQFGPARGISNTMEASEASIEFKDGLLLIVHTSSSD